MLNLNEARRKQKEKQRKCLLGAGACLAIVATLFLFGVLFSDHTTHLALYLLIFTLYAVYGFMTISLHEQNICSIIPYFLWNVYLLTA